MPYPLLALIYGCEAQNSMVKQNLRKISIDEKTYLWSVHRFSGGVEGKIVIYDAQHKGGALVVHFTWEQIGKHFPQTAIYKWTKAYGLPSIQRPLLAVRIVRYVTRQLGWQPQPHTAPLVIEDGYALLRDIGYEAASYREEASS